MNERTLQITTGAMFTAIFAVMLLINRQTGGIAEELIMFFLPIPMVGYASKYGFKTGIIVMAAMTLISIFFSTPTAIFYAATESLIGLVLGSGVYGKKDMTKVLLAVMGLSALANVFNSFVLAAMSGMGISEEVTYMQDTMNTVFTNSGLDEASIATLQAAITPTYILQMLVISVVLMGFLQGFVVFELSLLILKRLRFTVPQPKSLFLYAPPHWSAWLAMILFFVNSFVRALTLPELGKQIIQVLGICGYLYLCLWGFVAVMLFMKKSCGRHLFFPALIALVLFVTFPFAEAIAGFLYLNPYYHQRLLDRLVQ